MRTQPMKRLPLLCVLMVGMTLAGGCALFDEDLNLSPETVAALEAELDKQETELERLAGMLSPESQEAMAEVQAEIARISDVLEQAKSDTGSINAPQALIPFLPPPFDLIAAIAGLGLTTAHQYKKKMEARKNADSLIAGIKSAKKHDAELSAILKRNAGVIRKELTDEADKMIDEKG